MSLHRVIYACDENYAPLTAVSAVSLLKHNPGYEIILDNHIAGWFGP